MGIAALLVTSVSLLALTLAFTGGPAMWLVETGRPCLAILWLVLSVVAVAVIFELA